MDTKNNLGFLLCVIVLLVVFTGLFAIALVDNTRSKDYKSEDLYRIIDLEYQYICYSQGVRGGIWCTALGKNNVQP